jgi:hypothetical protein
MTTNWRVARNCQKLRCCRWKTKAGLPSAHRVNLNGHTYLVELLATVANAVLIIQFLCCGIREPRLDFWIVVSSHNLHGDTDLLLPIIDMISLTRCYDKAELNILVDVQSISLAHC